MYKDIKDRVAEAFKMEENDVLDFKVLYRSMDDPILIVMTLRPEAYPVSKIMAIFHEQTKAVKKS